MTAHLDEMSIDREVVVMKEFTVDFNLLKASLYGTEQEQGKARNSLKKMLEDYEESREDDMWLQMRDDQERAEYFNSADE